MVARYDMADGQFITLRHRDGKVHITAANMMVETEGHHHRLQEPRRLSKGRASKGRIQAEASHQTKDRKGRPPLVDR